MQWKNVLDALRSIEKEKAINEPISRAINEPINQTINQSGNQLNGQSVHRSINLSLNRLFNEAINTVNPTISRSITLPICILPTASHFYTNVYSCNKAVKQAGQLIFADSRYTSCERRFGLAHKQTGHMSSKLNKKQFFRASGPPVHGHDVGHVREVRACRLVVLCRCATANHPLMGFMSCNESRR